MQVKKKDSYRINMSRTIRGVIDRKITSKLPVIKQEPLKRLNSLSTLYTSLKEKLDSCPFKRRRKKVVKPINPTPTSTNRSSLSKPASNALKELTQRRIGTKCSGLLIPFSSKSPEPAPTEIKTILVKNKVDRDKWKERTELLEVLDFYNSIETIRKSAMDFLKKPASITETFITLKNLWWELLEKAENAYLDSAVAISIQYATYKVYADIHLLFRKTEQAIQIYKYAMLFSQVNNRWDLVLLLYGQVAYCCHVLGEYETALYYYQKQLKLAWQMKDHTIEAQAYDFMGIEYYYLGDIEKSVHYHDLSMKWGTASRIMQGNDADWLFGTPKKVSGEVLQSSEENYENKCINKMDYIRSKNFDAFLTREKMARIKKKLKTGVFALPSLNLDLYSTQPRFGSFSSSPASPKQNAWTTTTSPRGFLPEKAPHHKKVKSVSKIDMILRPYKMKLQTVKNLLSNPQKSLKKNAINFNSYSHLSSLRNTRGNFSMKATVQRLSGRIEEYKQVVLKFVFLQIESEGLMECYNELLAEVSTSIMTKIST